jgi:hypothetical protein
MLIVNRKDGNKKKNLSKNFRRSLGALTPATDAADKFLALKKIFVRKALVVGGLFSPARAFVDVCQEKLKFRFSGSRRSPHLSRLFTHIKCLFPFFGKK